MKISTNLILLATFASGLSVSTITAFGEDTDAPKIKTGDKWIYQETDSITNTPTSRLIWVVTEALDKTYSVNVEASNGNSIVDVYDYKQNGIQFGQFSYTPNDGTGVPANAMPGASWKHSFTWRDTDKGQGGRSETDGRCRTKESVTVAAGTFDDALKCITIIRSHAANEGPVNWETTITSWYSPKTIQWIKRLTEVRNHGHLATSKMQELIEYHVN